MENRRRSSPISARAEGPRTDAERAVIRKFRAKENLPMTTAPAKNEREPKEKPFEHIPGQAKLCRYLMKTKRVALCAHLTKYNEFKELNPNYPWAVESVLTEDLIAELSKGSAADAERVNELRSMIFAASWEATEAPDEKRLLAAVPSLLQAIPSLKALHTERAEAQRQAEREEKTSEEDERELGELESSIDLIKDAIHKRPCGDEGEPAVRAIEAFTNQTAHEIILLSRVNAASNEKRLTILRERMNRWRPIRNYLYYFRAYKRWCEISHAT